MDPVTGEMYKPPVKGRMINLINILDSIIEKKLSINEADDILEEIIDKFHDGELETIPQEELCLDKFEWTAIGFGIYLSVLAGWRKEGWPTKCSKCKKMINYREFGWKIVNDELVCIKC